MPVSSLGLTAFACVTFQKGRQNSKETKMEARERETERKEFIEETRYKFIVYDFNYVSTFFFL